MRKYRIATAAVLMTACATAELHSQMSMFFNRASEPAVYQDSSMQPNSSCAMPNCRTLRPYGHHVVSWRRWPEGLSEYTTNPQLSPFVIPDRSGAPDTIVPDALDEAEFFPKKRKRTETAPSEVPPSATEESDDGMTEDLPSVDPSDSVLPDVTDDDFPAGDFPTDDSDAIAPSSESDVFETPGFDDVPAVDNPLDALPGSDDDGFGTDIDDGFGDGFGDDFGSRELRRFHRDARSSEPAFDPRAEREAMLPLNGPDLVRATGAELSAKADTIDRTDGNPLRRKKLEQRPESVAHALHFDDRAVLANRDYRRQDYRRRVEDRYESRRDRPAGYDYRDARDYDARQIQYREQYQDRYPSRRRFDEPRSRYVDDPYERRQQQYRPMERATDSPAKSSNPLRP